MSMVDTRAVSAGAAPPAGPPLNVPKKKRHPGVWIGVTALVVLALLNSILLAVLSSVLAVGLSYLAAYAFARYTFPGSNAILVLLLLSSALPQVATVIPLFQMYSDLNLTDTIQVWYCCCPAC